MLSILSLPFDVVPAYIDETSASAVDPLRMVNSLARRKAEAVRHQCPGRIVVAADTVVSLDGRVLGKPDDAKHAESMLGALRGRWHRVWTGVAIAGGEGELVTAACVATHVRMRRYTLREAREYVATGDPMDKAAAYAIQHARFSPVAEIRGCRANVMGLPICVLASLLRRNGYACASPGMACSRYLDITCPFQVPRSVRRQRR